VLREERGRGEGECRIAPCYFVSKREGRETGELLHRKLQRIDPQPPDRSVLQCGSEGRIFLAEEAGHAFEERSRNGYGLMHEVIIISICGSKT